MGRLNVPILVVCEKKKKWINSSDFVSNGHRIIDVRDVENERGVGLILDKDKRKCVRLLAKFFWWFKSETIQYGNHSIIYSCAILLQRNGYVL